MMKNQKSRIKKSIIWILLILISSCGSNEICDEIIVFEFPNYRSIECEGMQGEELKECAIHKLLSDLYGALEYPPDALQYDIEGAVVVKFDVDKTGVTLNHEVTMSLCFGCDEEAVRLVKTFEFIPAKNECGDIITSTMSLYVRFRL